MLHQSRNDPLDPRNSFVASSYRELQLQTLAFSPKYQLAGVASDEGIKFWKIIDGPSPGRKLGCKRVNGASSRGKLGCKRVGGALSR
jgi:hypothetical protein